MEKVEEGNHQEGEGVTVNLLKPPPYKYLMCEYTPRCFTCRWTTAGHTFGNRISHLFHPTV